MSIVEVEYPVSRVDYLPYPDPLPQVDFFAALARRRTRREFAQPSTILLSQLLWFSGKVISTGEPHNSSWQHRIPPSAGGCHPIDLFVIQATRVQWYDPFAHALSEIETSDHQPLSDFYAAINATVPVSDGIALWSVAQLGRTLSRYTDGESLIWRDAGIVLATTCYCAEALGMAACPLGITGEPWISTILKAPGRAVGVGGCVVGALVDTADPESDLEKE